MMLIISDLNKIYYDRGLVVLTLLILPALGSCYTMIEFLVEIRHVIICYATMELNIRT